MTEEQKSEIIRLRSAGVTFSEIAKVLNLSQNTVKSFYRRCKEKLISDVSSNQCKFCGKTIIQSKGTREKKFCSDKCRMAWWNSHKEAVNKKAVYTFKCECCGMEFQAYGNDHRKYCSHPCYIESRFGGGSND